MTRSVTADERCWFLNTAEGTAGPYTVAEIRGWIAEGRITDEWHVWRDGAPAWTVIRENVAFRAALSAAATTAALPAPQEKAPAEEKKAGAKPAPAAQPAGPGFFRRLLLAAEGIVFAVRSGVQWTTSTIGRLIYPAFILALLLGLVYIQIHVWTTSRKFRSPGGYTVVLPGFYSKVSTNEERVAGLHLVSHEAIGGGTIVDLLNLVVPAHRLVDMLSTAKIVPPIRLFGMGHFELPQGRLTRQNRVKVLTDMTNGCVQAFQGEISARKDITHGRYAGQEANFSGTYEGTKIFGRLKCYVLTNKLIIVFFIGLVEEAIDDPAGEAFFQSLKFGD